MQMDQKMKVAVTPEEAGVTQGRFDEGRCERKQLHAVGPRATQVRTKSGQRHIKGHTINRQQIDDRSERKLLLGTVECDYDGEIAPGWQLA